MGYYIYKWEIEPKASFITPLHSDIIFGHIIWAINFISGEKVVEEYLSEFKKNNPPFIVSNGFIKGFLPNYFKNPEKLSLNKLISLVSKISENDSKKFHSLDYDLFNLRNVFINYEYINSCAFDSMRREEKGLPMIYRYILDIYSKKRCLLTLKALEEKREKNYNFNYENYKNSYDILEYEDLYKEKVIIKNSMNRLVGGTYEEGLYNLKETFYKENVCIYFKLRNDVDIELFEKYLKYIENMGYGKKASTGKGAFKTVDFSLEKDLFKNQYEGNGFVTLSNYIPKNGDYEEIISGKTSVKYGKVAGDFAERKNIFKRPFMYYKPGAVFKSNKLMENKGMMLANLNYDDKIVQYGIPFIVGVDL